MAEMVVNEIVTLSGMMDFFKDDLNTISKGEIKYKANFVLDLKLNEYTINAKMRASMKDKSYTVALTVTGDGDILKGHCECPRGNWICSHNAATAIYANKNGISKTDLPNSWTAKPKKAAKVEVKKFKDFFPTPKPKYKAISRPVTQADRHFLHSSLSELSMEGIHCPMQWITGPEPQKHPSNPMAPILIEEILQHFAENAELVVSKAKVTREQIIWLSTDTVGQRNNALWGAYCKMRLTGSTLGEVIKATERKQRSNLPIPPSLLKKLRGEYSFNKKDSVMWGQMHEETALKLYMQKNEYSVEDCGIFLFPCGFLESSQDGISTAGEEDGKPNKGVLEIKYQWAHRNTVVRDVSKSELKGKDKDTFYLTTERDLNKNHPYWHQVQAEIAATGSSRGHFVVWTNVDLHLIRVGKDQLWENRYLPMVMDFYH